METAKKVNGKIEYETTDGKKWRVTGTKRANGDGYEWSDLEEIK